MHTCVQHVQQEEAKSRRGLKFVNIPRIIRRNLQDCNAFFAAQSRGQLLEMSLLRSESLLLFADRSDSADFRLLFDGECDAGMELRLPRAVPSDQRVWRDSI